jgi:hypothetical protein
VTEAASPGFVLQDLLEPDAAHAVRNLLPEDAGGDLSALCVWPDQVRHWYKYRWTGPLHFIDTPDKACTFDYSSKLLQTISKQFNDHRRFFLFFCCDETR